MTTFATELDLFRVAVRSPFITDLEARRGNTPVLVEPKGLFGVPDLVLTSTEWTPFGPLFDTFAFEFKISNWRRALMQAFRYKAFAKVSYVLMDGFFVHRALRNFELFDRSNIGLLSVDPYGIVTEHRKPIPDKPYSPHVEHTLYSMLIDPTHHVDLSLFR